MYFFNKRTQILIFSTPFALPSCPILAQLRAAIIYPILTAAVYFSPSQPALHVDGAGLSLELAKLQKDGTIKKDA